MTGSAGRYGRIMDDRRWWLGRFVLTLLSAKAQADREMAGGVRGDLGIRLRYRNLGVLPIGKAVFLQQA